MDAKEGPPGRLLILKQHIMNYCKFTNPDGTTLAWVNLDTVHAAHPSKEGRVTLHTPTFTIEVDGSQFEEAIKKPQYEKELCGMLVRLTQAIDRMAVRIPSSIRLHM